MINVNTAGTMGDAAWQAFITELGARDYGRYMGVSLGVLEITAAQRRQAAAALRGNGVTVAIVTDDVLVRGIVTAVSWLGADVKSFPCAEMRDAVAWLGLGAQERELLETVAQLEAECLAELRARGSSS